jgi:methionyl-tRNA formyltransferase
MTPWPGACAWLQGKRFKITRSAIGAETGRLGAPGAIVGVGPAGAEVACGEGTILVLRGQHEGKRECDAAALAHGRCLVAGSQFTEPPPELPASDGH